MSLLLFRGEITPHLFHDFFSGPIIVFELPGTFFKAHHWNVNQRIMAVLKAKKVFGTDDS